MVGGLAGGDKGNGGVVSLHGGARGGAMVWLGDGVGMFGVGAIVGGVSQGGGAGVSGVGAIIGGVSPGDGAGVSGVGAIVGGV